MSAAWRSSCAFHIPDEIAVALTEFAAVEQLSRGDAICFILREYLVAGISVIRRLRISSGIAPQRRSFPP
jgi:hypothetical protein